MPIRRRQRSGRDGGSPPRTDGNSASSTRWPVSSGVLASSFAATGRGDRTGHVWSILYFCVRGKHAQGLSTRVDQVAPYRIVGQDDELLYICVEQEAAPL